MSLELPPEFGENDHPAGTLEGHALRSVLDLASAELGATVQLLAAERAAEPALRLRFNHPERVAEWSLRIRCDREKTYLIQALHWHASDEWELLDIVESSLGQR